MSTMELEGLRTDAPPSVERYLWSPRHWAISLASLLVASCGHLEDIAHPPGDSPQDAPEQRDATADAPVGTAADAPVDAPGCNTTALVSVCATAVATFVCNACWARCDEVKIAIDAQLACVALLRRPEVLPPAAQRILAPRQHLVEMLGELGAATMAIVDHRVVVVRHRARQQDFDLTSLRGLDQAVRERGVRRLIGSEEELPLRATAGDHVELTGKYLARQRHGPLPPPRTLPIRGLAILLC